MTTSHAFGFIFVGLGMTFAPAYWPESFLANALDGSSTSALWLEVMGPLNFLIGTLVALRNELTRLYAGIEEMDLLGWRMFDLSEVRWTMPASLYEVEFAPIKPQQIRTAA